MILKNPPPDKSITHRALLLSAIGRGVSKISNPLVSDDINATVTCLKKIGISLKCTKKQIIIVGNPDAFYQTKNISLNCQNSGTTLRHLLALLVCSQGKVILSGDYSLQKRPMQRIVEPLIKLGANVHYHKKSIKTAPLKILLAKKLQGGEIHLKIASAQVKSALLFYALLNHKKIILKGKISSRNHTENLLHYLGANIQYGDKIISLAPLSTRYRLPSLKISIPADPSSTLFYLFLFQQLKKNSAMLTLPNHYYNITRCYSWDMLKKSGHDLNFIPSSNTKSFEVEGTLFFKVNHHRKKGFHLAGKFSSYVIDEIPLLLAWALFLDEESTFENLEELAYKESDRFLEVKKIFACFNLEENLRGSKKKIHVYPIKGKKITKSTNYLGNDHRMLMLYHSLLMVSQQARKLTSKEKKIISVSNPQWESDLLKIFS